LLNFADDNFELSHPMKGGGCLRDHYNKVWESSGVKPYQLEKFTVPYPVFYLWEWFIELHNARQYGMEGALAITYTEIKAWKDLMEYDPTSQDIQIIKRLDLLAIKKR
jgi:hypothetical protein